MIKKFKPLSLIAVLLIVTLLAACSSAPASDNSAPSSSEQSAPSSEQSAPSLDSESSSASVPDTDPTPVCQHSYSSVITKKPTATVKGSITYTCSLCGDKYSEALPTEIKILAVGNSFSSDGMEYLWNVLRDAGVEKVTLGNLYIGGCSVDKHWSNAQSGKAAYSYRKNTYGSWTSRTDSLQTALSEEEWDFITVQQVSNYSGKPDTLGNLHNLVDYLNKNKTNPDAKLYWHMTWAYDKNSTHSGFAAYGKNQLTMYNAIVSTVKDTVLKETLISGYIPAGTTIQNLRTTHLKNSLTRDGYHLSYDFGRYAAALTWMTALTGISPEEVDWVPSDYSRVATYETMVDDAVISAISSPDKITPQS